MIRFFLRKKKYKNKKKIFCSVNKKGLSELFLIEKKEFLRFLKRKKKIIKIKIINKLYKLKIKNIYTHPFKKKIYNIEFCLKN
ncbi:hypothetical protein [Candidatus Vidania fulgoroideorum]